MYRGFNGYGYGYAGFPWGWLVMGIALFVVVAGIVYIAVKIGKTKTSRIGKSEDDSVLAGSALVPNSSSSQRALEILAERFAKGEIDAETYSLDSRDFIPMTAPRQQKPHKGPFAF